MRGSTAALMATAAAVLMLLVSLTVTDTWTISYEQETLGMFMEWKAKYGVTYEGVGEEECRYALFKNTHRRVVRTNAAGVTSGINGLSGLASEEIFLGRGVQIGEESYEEETRRMFVGWKAKYGRGCRADDKVVDVVRVNHQERLHPVEGGVEAEDRGRLQIDGSFLPRRG
ncbi:hypothetical protein PR202_ga06334 [Eleusine coracana subsp. coracana]|uniref:Cathepsin propeptide inhibitor domain-containing protein n=1 Tax=Eleusine coracana subsp. coracana TaxID=191504 RepID=A0AAV5BUN7_ELECO|nr:hypothetical protein PR202_ga06334 [Eleusine coracana subsp. coracana]